MPLQPTLGQPSPAAFALRAPTPQSMLLDTAAPREVPALRAWALGQGCDAALNVARRSFAEHGSREVSFGDGGAPVQGARILSVHRSGRACRATATPLDVLRAGLGINAPSAMFPVFTVQGGQLYTVPDPADSSRAIARINGPWTGRVLENMLPPLHPLVLRAGLAHAAVWLAEQAYARKVRREEEDAPDTATAAAFSGVLPDVDRGTLPTQDEPLPDVAGSEAAASTGTLGDAPLLSGLDFTNFDVYFADEDPEQARLAIDRLVTQLREGEQTLAAYDRVLAQRRTELEAVGVDLQAFRANLDADNVSLGRFRAALEGFGQNLAAYLARLDAEGLDVRRYDSETQAYLAGLQGFAANLRAVAERAGRRDASLTAAIETLRAERDAAFALIAPATP